jgi:hypothetical protein
MRKITEWEGNTIKVLTEDEANASFQGGHKIDALTNIYYSDLKFIFGSPSEIQTGDDKVQMTWVIEITDTEGNKGRFEIYDWKTYDLQYTKHKLDTWSIGGTGKHNPYILLEFINHARMSAFNVQDLYRKHNEIEDKLNQIMEIFK